MYVNLLSPKVTKFIFRTSQQGHFLRKTNEYKTLLLIEKHMKFKSPKKQYRLWFLINSKLSIRINSFIHLYGYLLLKSKLKNPSVNVEICLYESSTLKGCSIYNQAQELNCHVNNFFVFEINPLYE